MWNRDIKRIGIGVILVLLIIYLGFFRDTLFKNINYIIDQLYYSKEVEYYKVHFFYKHLLPMGVGGLLKFKWLLTLVFVFLNLLLSVGIIKSLFKEVKTLLQLLVGGYIVLFIISALLFLGGKLLGEANLGYTLARRFMGVLQSPVPLMVVAAAHILFGENK